MSRLLITGGTGTVGNLIVEKYLGQVPGAFNAIVVFSRDEFKQWEMKKRYKGNDKLRFMLGDIRDTPRLVRALEGVSHCIHAAALKQIDAGEYNPDEFVKTNINGTQNVIDACIQQNVDRLVFISTDKAIEPGCLYGCTKATAEKLVLHAKAIAGKHRTTFAVVRMGNIAYSRGSVVPFWKECKAAGVPLPVTDLTMTRYWVDGPELCRVVNTAVNGCSELYKPKAIAFKLIDLVDAFDHPHTVIGLRPGERLHEKLSETESSAKPERFMTEQELREAIK